MSGGGSTTTSSAPPAYLQPYLKDAASQAQSLYKGQWPGYYPGAQVTPFSNQSQQAMQMTENRALNGSPVNAANSGLAADTLNGRYLDPSSNPWLSGAYDAAARKVSDSVTSQFEGSNRYGSAMNQDVLGRNLGELANNIYGGNYANERNNQMQTMGLAPSIANQDYYDSSMLGGVGAGVENKAQQYLTGDVNAYNYYQNQPYEQLQQYMGLLQGQPNYGGTQTQNQNMSGMQTAGSALSTLGPLAYAAMFA